LPPEQVLAPDIRTVSMAIFSERLLNYPKLDEAVLYLLRRINVYHWLMKEDSVPVHACAYCNVVGPEFGHDGNSTPRVLPTRVIQAKVALAPLCSSRSHR
jgi:hypothetical protein